MLKSRCYMFEDAPVERSGVRTERLYDLGLLTQLKHALSYTFVVIAVTSGASLVRWYVIEEVDVRLELLLLRGKH